MVTEEGMCKSLLLLPHLREGFIVGLQQPESSAFQVFDEMPREAGEP